MNLQGKRALVTGAAGGIGPANVAALRAEGVRVCATDRATAGVVADAVIAGDLMDGAFCDGLPAAAAQGALVFTAQRSAAGFEDILADFTDPAAADLVIDAKKDCVGVLGILVNNAGIMREGSVEESSLEDWHLQLQVNLTAPFLLIRAAMTMVRAAKGVIVNVGSIEGLGSNPRHPAYGASKAGRHGLTRAVAVDHGPDGVRCNAVAPGWIDTALNGDFIASLGDPVQFRQEVGHIHEMRRTGRPEEVAELICWLASLAASFVTGQIYTIDGGRMAQLSLP